MGTQGTQGTSESREPNGRDRGTARRALLGAAGLGAGGAVLGRPGAARADARHGSGGHGGYKSLPTPTVIGHRGASGYRPEHTFGSYQLALDLGADVVEAGDLVPTKDGHLVCRHEPEIGGTTDVAAHSEFADRKTTKVLEGVSTTGWFTEDFTLAELKTLRAVERLPAVRQHNTLYDGLFQVPTFQEVLDLRARLSHELEREIGVYPETKHPTYFRAAGLPLEEVLVDALRRNGLNHADSPVFVQSFEAGNLRLLHDKFRLRAPKVFLTGATGNPFDDPRS